jgi:triacylglycerol lipase
MLDGIWGNGRWFSPLRRTLETRCGPVEHYRYNASGNIPFEILGAQLAEEIHRRDEPVNLLGFSMGGLVARAAHLLDPSLTIHRAAFLNSPHGGSIMAYMLPLSGARQMRPGAPFLRRLDTDDWKIPTLVVWCPLDAIVVPGGNARWRRASKSICSAMPLHLWPLFSHRLHEQIADFLAEGT